jgi:branched-subunit amino acid ABC-type transport system permease component
MSTIVLLAITGIGLGGLYFLVAAGLALIFGLMRVLNFAHGAFLLLGGYCAWLAGTQLADGAAVANLQFAAMLGVALSAGAAIGTLTELVLIRPLYRREVAQVLVTVGLALVVGALVIGIWGADPRNLPAPEWMHGTTGVLGAHVPNSRFVLIGAALLVLAGLQLFLRRTRYGLIVRAGVENRTMVSAMGIDVRRAFTLVFALGGAVAGLGGALAGVYFGAVSPGLGTTLLIDAFIVVVIGGLGSITGAALAALAVGLLQQFANYYVSGVGDLAIVLLLALVLLIRPRGLPGVAGMTEPTPAVPNLATSGPAQRTIRWTILLTIVLALAVVPWLDMPTGGVLPDRLNAPGSLQVLGLCLVFGALAMTYDLLFGFTGLLSFGHALFFATGAYTFAIAVTVLHLSGLEAFGLTLGVALVLPLAVGAVSLRTSGIAFAMVTLAFAQAGAVIVGRNPWHATGGELGLGMSYDRLPQFLVGVVNTRYLYWICVGLLIVVAGVIAWLRGSVTGRVWQAIRENERRVQILGLHPYTFKLLAFMAASFLAALCGVAYLLLVGGANPSIASAEFTLTLLVMAVLGGAGTRWGALVGGVLYSFLDQRLAGLAGSPLFSTLPSPLRVPLSQPLFILGLIFILVILFRPAGVVSLFGTSTHALRRWLRWRGLDRRDTA